MKNEKSDQCVIISGESGQSEKAEFVKSVILDSNPLLEAFGNAKDHPKQQQLVGLWEVL